jgi:hypothetical protein
MQDRVYEPTAHQKQAADTASRLAMAGFFVSITWAFFMSGNPDFAFWKWGLLSVLGSPIAAMVICIPLAILVSAITAGMKRGSNGANIVFNLTTWVAPIATFFLAKPVIGFVA